MSPQPTFPLALMYALAPAVALSSFLCTRGPDGRLSLFFLLSALIAAAYITLAFLTRDQPIRLHITAHAALFLAAAFIGFIPIPNRPRLDGMAGMLYLFIPIAAATTVALGALTRLIPILTLRLF